MNNAYVTLLSSEDYIDAVLVLAASLNKVRSRFPLLVAIVEDIYNEELDYLLKEFGCDIEVVPRLQYSTEVQNTCAGKSVLNTASKIQIFDFKRFDKLVYIDADSLVLENIDELFDWPDGSMMFYDGDETGSSNLFVITPKFHHESIYYIHLMEHFDVFDGNLFGDFWFHVLESPYHRIPRRFGYHYNPETRVPDNIKAIHYCNNPKPWLEPNAKEYSNLYPFARIYKLHLQDTLNFKAKILKKYKTKYSLDKSV